jgi:hypothetical protein
MAPAPLASPIDATFEPSGIPPGNIPAGADHGRQPNGNPLRGLKEDQELISLA